MTTTGCISNTSSFCSKYAIEVQPPVMLVMDRLLQGPRRSTHEFKETCHSVTSYFMKKTPNDAVTPQRQSQFTPKMKANAVPHLLSSQVRIE